VVYGIIIIIFVKIPSRSRTFTRLISNETKISYGFIKPLNFPIKEKIVTIIAFS